MQFAVTRDGETLVTLHEGTDTTAIDAALEQLRRALEDDQRVHWDLGEGSVHEHPAAPFDPYPVAVEVSITVTVDADTEEEAVTVGEQTIEEVVADVGLDGVTYTTGPRASAS